MEQTSYFKGWKKAAMCFIAVALFFASSCNSDTKQKTEPTEEIPEGRVEIITEAMEFQMPDTITSGWNLWQYHNKSNQTHFILIDKYPEGITLDSVVQRVLPVFGDGMTLLNEGKTDEGFAEFGKLPPWFSEVMWPGGVGLLSPGRTAETILHLDPGYYLVECYVKMENGMFHTNLGMIEELVVAEEKSKLAEPEADIAIDISSESGIEFEPPLSAGTYTFSVNYLDQKTYDNFLGHDLNLVKLEDGADEAVLEAWMDWRDPKGLIEPAPEGFVFLGGVNDMPEGGKGYFNASLEPGKYALISEVPNASEHGLLKTFVISE